MPTLTLDPPSRSSAKIENKVAASKTPETPRVVADIFETLGVDNYHVWAWDNYKRVVSSLCSGLGARRIIEIGGGRDPLFDRAEIDALGVEMIINDISPDELAVL